MGILPARHFFDVRMTSYKKSFVDFGFRIQKYIATANLSKIKPISWKICKFLHFSVPRHIHNKRLPWQHLRLMRIVIMCKMTPIRIRLNLKNFILISCAVLELLRKVSQGGGAESAPPPGEIGLTSGFDCLQLALQCILQYKLINFFRIKNYFWGQSKKRCN